MSFDGEDQTRRTALKTLSAGAFSIVAMGKTVGADENQINTSFDPESKESVARFVDRSLERSEQIRAQVDSSTKKEEKLQKERDQIARNIDEKQSNAIAEFLENDISLEIEKDESTSSTGGEAAPSDAHPADYWTVTSFEETVTAKIDVPYVGGSREAFDYTHRIEWEHRSGYGVRNINSIGSADTNSFALVTWNYNGDEDQTIQIRQGGNFFNSDLTGVFDRCIWIATSYTCTTTDRMYTRTNGNWNGTGALTRQEIR